MKRNKLNLISWIVLIVITGIAFGQEEGSPLFLDGFYEKTDVSISQYELWLNTPITVGMVLEYVEDSWIDTTIKCGIVWKVEYPYDKNVPCAVPYEECDTTYTQINPLGTRFRKWLNQNRK